MLKKTIELYRRLKNERGSALLVSLMVIVGLSMLGLGFVALSETEAAISVNQRNREEVLSHAEAAAGVIVDWFQNPVWALSKGLMPSNDPTVNTELLTMKAVRVTTGDRYKPDATSLLFDLPFKPASKDRLYGDVDHPDVLINATTAPIFLAAFNKALFSDTLDAGEISEIRIYAPPIANGSKDSGFYKTGTAGGTRYGVASIRVTAVKYDNPNKTNPQIVAQRVVTEVVTEFPFPGPNGPIQSNSSIGVNGNFQVYWGQVSSILDLQLKATTVVPGLPWVNAWDRVKFEHGYDSSFEWTPNTTYKQGDVIHASTTKINLDPSLKGHAFKCIMAGGWTTGAAATEPGWNSSNTTGLGQTYVEGASASAVWQEQPPKMWPNYKSDSTFNTDVYNWLYQLLGMQFVDPWAQARSRKNVYFTSGTPVNNNPEVYGRYTNPASTPMTTMFCWFQNQTKNEVPDYQIVNFPNINYDFWKQIALAGDGQVGIYYFAFDDKTGMFYRKSNPANEKPFATWTNACTGITGALGPGFYFFDTVGGKNPQIAGNPALLLTPDEKITASVAKPCYCMKGFIYLNAATFGTQGSGLKGETTKYYAFPGEPYRDIGYQPVDHATLKYKRDASGNLLARVGVNNSEWSYDDVNENGKFDLYVTDITKGGTVNIPKPDGSGNLPNPTYVPVEFYEGCTIGDNTVAGANCSEPHEPFLNMIYPADTGSPTAALAPVTPSPSQVTIGWEAPASPTRLPKVATDSTSTAVVDCTNSANYSKCTTDGYDSTGPLTLLPGGPMLEGVLYVEGGYDAQGNATYYGSVLVKGPVSGSGSPQIYFDESLLTGDFKKKFPNYPRVYVSSYQTEQ